MLIRINDFDGEIVNLLDEVVSLKYEKNLNSFGKCEFVLHYLEPKLKSDLIKLFYRIEIIEFE